MAEGIHWIIQRLVERFVPLIGSLFSSTVETFLAIGVAEQQSHLEEAARRYEAEGKPEIALALRNRAASLSSDNPAAGALRITQNLRENPLLPEPDEAPESLALPQLSDSRAAKPKPRKKKASSPQHTPKHQSLPSLDSNSNSSEGTS